MATQNKVPAARDLAHANAFGNACVKPFSLSLKNFALNDLVNLLHLPAGAKPLDIVIVKDGTGAATSTMKVGLKGVNGVAQDDDDYFATGPQVALDAAGLVRKQTATAPVLLADETIVQGTILVAGVGAGACVVSGHVLYEFVGNP